MKTYLTLLNLCFILTFYTYSSYSADDKCPSTFKYDKEKEEFVLNEDTRGIGGGMFPKGTSVKAMRNAEKMVQAKLPHLYR